MPVNVNLSGKEKVLRAILDEAEKKMTKTAAWLVGYTKRSVSRGNVTGYDPSKPGEPPKVVTGTLRSEIDLAVVRSSNDLKGYIGVKKGTPAEGYGFYLELGTSKMAARPYLRPAIINNREKIKSMLGVKG